MIERNRVLIKNPIKMYLDTKDLAEKREELKEEILDSFLETFEHYAEQTETFEDIMFDEEEIESWKADWQEDLEEIAAIDQVEEEVERYGEDDFDFGTTLISDYDFQEYCEEFCKDKWLASHIKGFISDNLPELIENNIDWSGIADDMREDFSEVEYQGTIYLFR